MARKNLGTLASEGTHVLTRDAADARYSLIGGSSAFIPSDTPPDSPTSSTLWLDTTTGRLYAHHDGTWFEVTGGGPPPAYSNRNLLDNGDFAVAQRASIVSGISTAGYRTADRWYIYSLAAGTWTCSIEANGSTFPNAPTHTSLKLLCTTANNSLSANSDLRIWQAIEGINLQSLMKGKAGARPLTLSFWVKTNLAGTYVAMLYDLANNRHISKTYTLLANVATKVTITFPSDVVGEIANTINASLYLSFYLAAGSDSTSGGLATSWATLNVTKNATGQVNLAATVGNYFQITAVQLEIGPVATDFEQLPFPQQFERCRRYFKRWGDSVYTMMGQGFAWHAQNAHFFLPLSTPMRILPTLAVSDPSHMRVTDGVSTWTGSVLTLDSTHYRRNWANSCDMVYVNIQTTAATMTQFRPMYWTAMNNASAWVSLSADL